MANETIVLDASTLFIHLDGFRIDGFPDAGTIATDNKVAPEADFIGALNNSGVAVINNSTVREVVVNVLPLGQAHAAFKAAVRLQRALFIHAFSIEYGASKWLSTSCVITSLGTNTFNADGVEFVPITLKGLFSTFTISAFTAPANVTTEQLEAAIAAG